MVRFNEPIEPMTLGNMHANGVRSLAVSCHLCHHEAVISDAPCRRSGLAWYALSAGSSARTRGRTGARNGRDS